MRLVAAMTLVSVALLTGCGPLVTQSPGEGYSPVNAVSTDDESRLLLAGHDVVNYFTDGAPRMGSVEHRSEYKGVALWFASAEHKQAFDAEPERYLPQFGGYCTNGISYGIPWGGDADTWSIIDGKLYIFGGSGSKDAFMLDPAGNMAHANRYWGEEVANSNALIQRARRLVFRVPHYKSGAELAEAVARSKQ
ncbi:MAG: YHS domain-containing (seleno)protein [Burkholderiaceae bacterium]